MLGINAYATHTRHNEIMMMIVLYATAIFPCMFVGDVQLSHEQMNSIYNLLPLPTVHLTVHYTCIQLKR